MTYRFPNQAFDHLVHMLNKKNLDRLLSISSLMSLIDYYDTMTYGHNLFAPILNVESINLFDQALISSKSANYKSEDITRDDLILFYRAWLDVIGFRQKYTEKFSDKKEGFNRQTLTMISTQLRYQSYSVVYRLSRAYALFIAIPQEYIFSLKQKDSHFVNIPIVFEVHCGVSILNFLRAGISLEAWYFNTLEMFLPEQKRKSIREYILSRAKGYYDKDNLEDKFSAFISIYKSVQNKVSFFFAVENFDEKVIPREQVRKYLELTSATLMDLKSIRNNNQAYDKGIVLDRLSPLERYPIVRSEKKGFIIPNFRYFEIALTELLHYIMQEISPDNYYNQTRGYIQEIYIKRLISDIYDPKFIITETKYKKAGRHVLGPDLCLCDGKLILIESKAKRLSAITRADPTESAFIQDVSAAIEALVKLPDKVSDLYLGLPEYAGFHDAC